MDPQLRLERWERRAEWPLAFLALLFLAFYSVEVLAQPQGAARPWWCFRCSDRCGFFDSSC
jgi:hypothetical protein